ncbi:MAG: hypothetical protein AAF384_06340 [Pseudomonadota bacterium]
MIAHWQGNFFAEGVAYRLHKGLDRQGTGTKIFNKRLGIISLGSPTSYDALPTRYRYDRIKHFTRADDGIVMLRAFGGPAKRPWPAKDDLAPLWPWRPANLQAALRLWDGKTGFPAFAAMNLAPPASVRPRIKRCTYH